jgi:putative restriction endonuclease
MREDQNDVVDLVTRLRQYTKDGRRHPHKPLLVLLALHRLQETGSSSLTWSGTEQKLADLIREFGPSSRTGRRQTAAYPFTHLRSDGVWTLDRDVPMDRIRPLDERQVTGRLHPTIEAALRHRPDLVHTAARTLAENHFPETVGVDVLATVGFDVDSVLARPPIEDTERARRRSAAWPAQVLAAWNQQCAFCDYDGRLAGAPVGLDAAHVRGFKLGGPDDLDNGLALCTLHHKLFDRGVLGIDENHRLTVSTSFAATSETGKRIYDLHAHPLRPSRPVTALPAIDHVRWHAREVFKHPALA